MAISSVIKFGGKPDDLVWKSDIEDFNATSQLIVDETHEAILVVNGNAADLFGPGSHTLSTPNTPLLRRIVSLPTGGETPFPCKVFYINKVHQMDLLWGTQGPIALEDPLYDIFMHVMLRGSMSISVEDSRKFLLKIVGFRGSFDADTLIAKFRGIISSNVKDCISKIMINGKLSYFMMNANLAEVSDVVKERLDQIFEDYGVLVQFFNIETIEVPEKDYAAITQAKNQRSSRIIQGYTWQEERQMMIAEKFAANEGTMGEMGGVIGGAMGGIMMGGTIGELARSALSPDRIPTQAPPKDVSSVTAPMGSNAASQSVRDILESGRNAAPAQPQPVQPEQGLTGIGVAPFDVDSDFGSQSTTAQVPSTGAKFCPSCGQALSGNPKFCPECGTKLSRVCPNCGTPIEGNAKFCSECGTRL